MTLIDAGPLVALSDLRDPYHRACAEEAERLSTGGLLTTWPCLSEAMYLLGEAGGWTYQERLWKLYLIGRLRLYHPSPDEIRRIVTLMAKYRDTPMDLADASLMVTAETHQLKQVFSLDSDFRIYRLADGSALEVVP